MTRMTKSVSGLLVSAMVCLAVASPVEAQNRRRHARPTVAARSSNADSTRTRASFRMVSPYDSWRYDYPKYDGGFHSRYFLEMRYPTGDRPVRGTAW
ncbi:MAG: hypothetical protein ACYC6N_30530 [Pirellulaceae bacterium]